MLQGLNRFTRLIVGFIGVGCILTSQMSLAAKVSDLYEAEIPVASQSRSDRRVAIKAAFAEVLVRISGQQDVVLALPPLIETDAIPLKETPNQGKTKLSLVGKTAIIAEALSKPTYYVKQFRYQKPTGRPHMDWGLEPADKLKTDKTKPVQQVLWIRFNKKKINKLLHETSMPVWGKTRPSILVWMVVENRSRRYLLSNSIQSSTREAIEKHARLYGLPIRLPLMDLADRANIGVADVWGNFEERIINGSKRYQTEAILVGKLYIANRSWNTQWSLYVNGRKVNWEGQDISLDTIVKKGLSRAAQNLSQAFADVKTDQGTQNVLLEIKGLNGLADYAQTTKYLSSLSAVKNVQTIKLNKTKVLFNLTTQGSRVGVMQAISLGSQLVAEPNTIPTQVAIPILNEAENAVAQVQQPIELVPDLIYRLLK